MSQAGRWRNGAAECFYFTVSVLKQRLNQKPGEEINGLAKETAKL